MTLKSYTVIGYTDKPYGVEPFVEHVLATDWSDAFTVAAQDVKARGDDPDDNATEIVTYDGHLAPSGVAPIAAPQTVWTLHYEHKHGSDISAYWTEEDARAAKVGIAKEYWSDRAHDDVLGSDPEDSDSFEGLTDDEIVSAYFDDNEREWATIESTIIQGTPPAASKEG